MGRDVFIYAGHNPGMAQFNAEAAFVDSLCQRTQELRVARGWTQEQMATALGIPLDRYKKYEIRSALPMYLVERFALIVGQDVEYVVTGQHAQRLTPVPAPPRRAKGGSR